MIFYHLVNQHDVYVQVDSDCDGYTSAALLLNYLHDIAPVTVENHWSYGLHKAKLHGIDIDNIPEGTKLVIAPDSSSNEADKHKILVEKGIDVVVLDHHEAEIVDDPAIIVNNQLCSYKNKYLSGVGVVYKLLQCMDNMRHQPNAATYYLDLVALGLTGDMMDMRDPETHYYITEGFKHIENPFFVYLAEKNEFSMKGKFTPFTVAWYIVPYINSVTRVGDDKDKLLIFEAMLNWKAGEIIPSDKRGTRNEKEMRVDQAVRHAGNIKRHQDDEKKKLLDEIHDKIDKYSLGDFPLIIVQNQAIEDDDPIRGITGLVANVIMAEFNKPTLILNELQTEKGTIWSGSGRGFKIGNIDNWRDYIANTGLAEFAQGHAGAFGVAFTPENLEKFKAKIIEEFGGTNKFEKTYEVDFIWTPNDDFDNIIIDIGRYKNLWGQGVPEPLVAIEHIKITDETMLNLYTKGVLKINLKPHKTSCVKFNSDLNEYQNMIGKTITIVGTCEVNEYNGFENPQIKVVDYFFETVSNWDF